MPPVHAHSGLLLCKAEMRLTKAAAAVSNPFTAVTRGSVWGTCGLALSEDRGFPELPCWGVLTQADIVLL